MKGVFKETKKYLFGQCPPAQVVPAVELVGLPEQGIEGLAGPAGGRGVGRDGEGGHPGELLGRVLALAGRVEQVRVLKLLRQALQHR